MRSADADEGVSVRISSQWGRLIALGFVTASPSVARAETTEKAAAEALFQSGRDLVRQGNVVDGCRRFEASQHLDPALGTMLHLADCYEREGRTASAWALFGEAASIAVETGQASRESLARTRIASLEPRLVRVEVVVPAASRVPGLTIRMGALDVGAEWWGVAFPVDPGEQVVTASAPGRRTWTKIIRLDPGVTDATPRGPVPTSNRDEGARSGEPGPGDAGPGDGPHAIGGAPDAATPRVESIEVPALSPLAAIHTDALAPRDAFYPRPDAHSPEVIPVQRVVGFAVGSAGLVGLGVGTALGVQAITKNAASLHECRANDPTRCNPDGVALRNQAKTSALGSTIAFATGAGLVITGVVVLLTAPKDATAKSLEKVRPIVSQNGGVVVYGGEW